MVGWALTEVDDEGKVLPLPEAAAPPPRTLEFFWRTKIGRGIREYKGVIGRTAWNWLSAGVSAVSSKVIGLLGLVLGMIRVPVELFIFLKDSAGIRDQLLFSRSPSRSSAPHAHQP